MKIKEEYTLDRETLSFIGCDVDASVEVVNAVMITA
jgi:hypothetical protein